MSTQAPARTKLIPEVSHGPNLFGQAGPANRGPSHARRRYDSRLIKARRHTRQLLSYLRPSPPGENPQYCHEHITSGADAGLLHISREARLGCPRTMAT